MNLLFIVAPAAHKYLRAACTSVDNERLFSAAKHEAIDKEREIYLWY